MKNSFILITILLASLLVTGCGAGRADSSATGGRLMLATTTSTYDSGLLDYLLPYFTEETGYEVSVISLGTGQALETAKNGDVDVVLVHAKPAELKMVAEGYFTDRYDVMYNDFVLVGMEDDPAGVGQLEDVNQVFAALAQSHAPFVSRGDDSGTHSKEQSLWEAAGVTLVGDWYISAGSGMADTLRMADEMEGYTLTDRATYLSMQDSLDLKILFAGDELLFNQYGVMAVNPDNYPEIDYEGALKLIEFMISAHGQELIENYQPFGGPLFFPSVD